jgi:hypothetical protein
MISYDIKKYFKPSKVDKDDGKRRGSVMNAGNQESTAVQYRTEINVDDVDQSNSRGGGPSNNYATINSSTNQTRPQFI